MDNIYNKEMASMSIKFLNKIINNCTYDIFNDDYKYIIDKINKFYNVLINNNFDSYSDDPSDSKLILGNIINIFKAIINSSEVKILSIKNSSLSNDINEIYDIIKNLQLDQMDSEKNINNISLKIMNIIDRIFNGIILYKQNHHINMYDYSSINMMCDTLINSFISNRCMEVYDLP